MLFGEYETVLELIAFICKACFASFYFAHRVVWFLKSLLKIDSPKIEKYFYLKVLELKKFYILYKLYSNQIKKMLWRDYTFQDQMN